MQKKNTRTFFLFFAFLLLRGITPTVLAQDIKSEVDKVKNLKNLPKQLWEAGIKASGSISSSTTFYDAKTIENRRQPFESYLSGNINFDLFGKIKMPFTFSVNSQQFNWTAPNFINPFDRKIRIQQPFNRFQFRPTYKGVTLLLGVNSMTFSPLTLSGHRFNGLGVIFKPSKFPLYGNVMVGKLVKAVGIDSLNQTRVNLPAYERKGFGIQLGYRQKNSAVEAIIFEAKDQPNSLPYSLGALRIFPKQNAVAALKGNTILKDKIELQAEYAISGLTENTLSELQRPQATQFQQFGGLLGVNATTIYRKAIKASVNYKAKTFTVGTSYNHIDPDYRTLGAYFFTNDLENITANVGTQLMQGKLSFMGNIGRQRDNLENQKSQSLSQWVGSSNLVFAPSEFTTLTGMYSNFTSFTNLRTELDYLTTVAAYAALDTLNYRQISQNLMANIMHTFGKPDSSVKQRTILMSDILYQKSDDKQGSFTQGSRIANLNLNINRTNQDKNTSMGIGTTIARNDYLLYQDWLLGPVASYSRAFFDNKVQARTNLTYLQTFGEQQSNSRIFNANLSISGSIKEKHNLSFTTLFMNRKVQEITITSNDFWQITAMLNYSYSFELLNTSKKKK